MISPIRCLIVFVLVLAAGTSVSYGAGGDPSPPVLTPAPIAPPQAQFRLRVYVVSYLVPFDGVQCDTSHPTVNLADRVTLWVESDDPLETGRQVASGDGSAEAVVYGDFHIGYDVWSRASIHECPGMAYRETEVGDYYAAYKRVELFRYAVGEWEGGD